MSKAKYSYNHKTLRYERVGIRWGSIIFGMVSLLVFGALFFISLVFLQSKLFETKEEARLRQENESLKKHKDVVATELSNTEVSLASLYQQESDLHKKVFLTDKPVELIKVDRTAEIMEYDLHDFKQLTNALLNKTSKNLGKASVMSYEFSKLFWPSKDDVSELAYYPTKTPVKNFNMKALASGFGNQINPFNKRMYRHNGIDIICERGTEVIATGKGTVVAAVMDDTPGGKGSYVVIEHAKGYQSRYAHLSYVSVSYGQKITQGQALGTVGASGSAIAPHLHYEILKNGNVINPVLFFVEDLSESEIYQLAKLNNQVKQSLD
jgi:murein DD-endopeptidase MepM/ murein hydrolase activator NlpD